MNDINKSFLFLMLFSPIISYFTQKYWEINSNTVFGIITYPVLLLSVIKQGSLKDFQNNKFIIPGILLGVYIFIWSQYNGEMYGDSLYSSIQVTLLNNRYLQSVAMVLLIYKTRFNTDFIRKVITVLKLTLLLASLTTIVQMIYDPMFLIVSDINHEYMYLRYNSIITNQNVSIYGNLWHEIDYSFLPIVGLLIGSKIIGGNNKNLIAFMGAIVAVGTNSRTTMLAFATALLPLVLGNKDKIKQLLKYLSIVLIGVCVIIVFLIGIGYDLQSWINQRLLSDSYTTRISAFKAVAEHVPGNIMVGTGSVSNSLDINWKLKMYGGTQIHNGYLATFVYYGILGIFLLLWFYFTLFKKLLKNAKLTSNYASLIGLIIFLQVQMTTIPFGGIFAYGLLYCFVFDKYYSDLHRIPELIDSRKTIIQ